MNPFKLTLSFDGSCLTVDYNDGSDKERHVAKTEADLLSVVQDAVRTALSDESD